MVRGSASNFRAECSQRAIKPKPSGTRTMADIVCSRFGQNEEMDLTKLNPTSATSGNENSDPTPITEISLSGTLQQDKVHIRDSQSVSHQSGLIEATPSSGPIQIPGTQKTEFSEKNDDSENISEMVIESTKAIEPITETDPCLTDTKKTTKKRRGSRSRSNPRKSTKDSEKELSLTDK